MCAGEPRRRGHEGRIRLAPCLLLGKLGLLLVLARGRVVRLFAAETLCGRGKRGGWDFLLLV